MIQDSPSCQAFGASPAVRDGRQGWFFRLYAPHAVAASVVGPFNQWDVSRNPMHKNGGSFTAFLPGLHEYDPYKFALRLADGSLRYMADPYAFHSATPPDGCSKLYNLRRYDWQDQNWFAWCAKHPLDDGEPLHLYEVHLGSWRRTGEGKYLPYRVIAQYLVPYVKEMGFTGVLLLPVMEHADAASLGYVPNGWFAPTSRFGAPADFMYLVDQLHRAGVSVFMDFPTERFSAVEYGLAAPDGIPPYARPGYTASGAGGSCPFSLTDDRVRQYLFTAARFWMVEYHLDGLRLRHADPPPSASRLFRAISRAAQELSPPRLILSDGRRIGGALVTVEDWVGNLLDAVSHAGEGEASPTLTLRPAPRYSVLTLDHTVLASRGGSLVNAFAGTFEKKLARARLTHLLLLACPGKKLTFMGTEFGQDRRWHPEYSLDWHQLHYSAAPCQQAFFRDANLLYLRAAALHASDDPASSFEANPRPFFSRNHLLTFRRQGGGETVYAVFNFSDTAVRRVRIGVDKRGYYRVLLNSDGCCYGGQGRGSFGRWLCEDVPADGFACSLQLEVPPLGGVLLSYDDALARLPTPVSPC